ncbi:DUF7094 domain-containing protein [Halobacteriaceae archaeon SHR40]|uniref:DUF7094 domain-containing protein n=1 Tax=Halovenus amylolytica TaxID=2500550 RepID=UPI000FE32641
MPKVPRVVIFFTLCVFCLFVVGSGVTVAVDAFQDGNSDQETIETVEDSTNYLSPAVETDDQYQEVSIDVASAVDSSAQELQTEHDIRSFTRELQFVDGIETQGELGQKRLEVVEGRYLALDQRQQALFEQYSTGEMSSNRFARELVRLGTAIKTQRSYRERIFTEVYDGRPTAPSEDFQRRFNSLELSLTPEQPVTERLRSAMTGAGDPALVYSQSAEEVLVLATIDDETYVRQATLRDERNLGAEDQFTDLWRDATNRAGSLYPWAFSSENLRDVDPFNLEVYSQVYAVRAQHSHGELSVYLDGATRNVFHENQLKRVQSLPVTQSVQNESDDLVGNVSLTNGAGPMLVSVTDDAGAPIEDASIIVDSDPVGLTDSDGELWVVQPSGEAEVGITTEGDETVSVQIPESD